MVRLGAGPRVPAATAAAVGVAVALAAGVGHDVLASPRESAHVVAGVVQLAGLAALAARGRAPMLVLAVEVGVFAAVHLLLGSQQPPYPLVLVAIAAAAVGSRLPPRRAVTASAVALGCVLVAATGVRAPVDLPGPTAIQYVLLLTAATAVGLNVRARRDLLAGYRERARQAEREQQLVAAQAVVGERRRVARDLHDTVAHHVSLLVVQAGAVRESLPRDHPSRPVLDSMIRGGRQAMAELREMLAALRDDLRDQAGGDTGDDIRGIDPAPPLGPAPGAERIPDLVAGMRAAGLRVELDVRGEAPEVLGPGTSLAAYRIVQEALTNVARHAPGSPATVTLDHGVEALRVRVTNPASPGPNGGGPNGGGPNGGGHGLIGMRERAVLTHGTLTAGPRGGVFVVEAVLPYSPGRTAP